MNLMDVLQYYSNKRNRDSSPLMSKYCIDCACQVINITSTAGIRSRRSSIDRQ